MENLKINFKKLIRNPFLVSLFVMAIASGANAEDYCSMESCRNRPHIGCGDTGTWSPTCPADKILVKITQTYQDQILNLHNTLRNKIASGGESGFKPATRMATMVRHLIYIQISQFNMGFSTAIHYWMVYYIFLIIQKTWNNELAYLCTINVRQCKMNHDECRNTLQFDFAGQNLALRSRTGRYEPVDSFLKNAILQWYGEIKDAGQADIDKCCDAETG